jgi:shikimate dehydrogenase
LRRRRGHNCRLIVAERELGPSWMPGEALRDAAAVCDSPSVQPILVLVGRPIGGNPTQFMMERAFARHEMDWRYLSVEVAPEDLVDAVRGIRAMGFRGGNCADPHREAIVPLLDRTDEVARHTGAVSCILREGHALIGENTDGRGLMESLRRRVDPAGKRVVLLGAGRMARAIGVELALAKAAEIVVVDRTESRGRALVEALRGPLGATASLVVWDDEYPVSSDTDALVCALASSPEDADEPLPVSLHQLSPRATVADVAYNPPHAWLVREASERGAATIEGLEVFIERCAVDFRLWTGVDPDPNVMREAVEEFLEL